MAISYKKFRKKLVDVDKNLTDISKETGINKNSLTKINNDEFVSMRILDILCDYFNCDYSDLIEHISDSPTKK